MKRLILIMISVVIVAFVSCNSNLGEQENNNSINTQSINNSIKNDETKIYEDYLSLSAVIEVGNYRILATDSAKYTAVDKKTNKKKLFFESDGYNLGCRRINDSEFIIVYGTDSDNNYFIKRFSTKDFKEVKDKRLQSSMYLTNIFFVGKDLFCLQTESWGSTDDENYDVSNLISINSNGSVESKINNVISDFYIVGNKAYYSKNNKVYRTDLSFNTHEEVLDIEKEFNKKLFSFNVKSDVILLEFADADAITGVYDLNKKISDTISVKLRVNDCVESSSSYYMPSSSDDGLYEINKNNKEATKISELYPTQLSLVDNKLYFSTVLRYEGENIISKSGLYEMDLGDRKVSKIQ